MICFLFFVLNTSLKEKMIIISKLERMRENTSVLISWRETSEVEGKLIRMNGLRPQVRTQALLNFKIKKHNHPTGYIYYVCDNILFPTKWLYIVVFFRKGQGFK